MINCVYFSFVEDDTDIETGADEKGDGRFSLKIKFLNTFGKDVGNRKSMLNSRASRFMVVFGEKGNSNLDAVISSNLDLLKA